MKIIGSIKIELLKKTIKLIITISFLLSTAVNASDNSMYGFIDKGNNSYFNEDSSIEISDEKPNFVFFLIDDLGWTDLGCFGSSFYETPGIDRLAKEGIRFTNAYAAAPVCSPTRNSIMCGKYPARTGKTNIGAPMPPEELTFAEVLHANGYTTYFSGKWHLGGSTSCLPESQGFDINIGGCEYGQPPTYFYPYESDRHAKFDKPIPGLEEGVEGEYLTDRLTDEAISFLKNHGKGEKPFLLYLSHYAVHTPIQAKKELTEKYVRKAEKLGIAGNEETFEYNKQKKIQNYPEYAAMIESMDQSIERILNMLNEMSLTEKTVVVFMSDNGGLSTKGGSPTSNLPLRAGKGHLYEGGIRVPMIIKWTKSPILGETCNAPVTSTDFYPTMLELAGLPLATEQHADGLSLLQLLKGAKSLNREALYWHYPHNHSAGGRAAGAIRLGDFKLIEFFDDHHIELYNLAEDIGELNDLSEKNPKMRGKLFKMLKNWQKQINPNISYGKITNKKSNKTK